MLGLVGLGFIIDYWCWVVCVPLGCCLGTCCCGLLLVFCWFGMLDWLLVLDFVLVCL